MRHHHRQEPYAVMLHVRICAGGGGQLPSLPRPQAPEADVEQRPVTQRLMTHSGVGPLTAPAYAKPHEPSRRRSVWTNARFWELIEPVPVSQAITVKTPQRKGSLDDYRHFAAAFLNLELTSNTDSIAARPRRPGRVALQHLQQLPSHVPRLCGARYRHTRVLRA